MDRFNFRISFVTDNNTTAINNLRLIFLFSYEFKINIVGKMNTAAFIDIDTPLGASYIKVTGNLNLKQKSPIDRTTFYNEKYYENFLNDEYYGEKSIKNIDLFISYSHCNKYYNCTCKW